MTKLTDIQRAALTELFTGPKDYYELCKVGARGQTISSLCKKGLAKELQKHRIEGRRWAITPEGSRLLLAEG